MNLFKKLIKISEYMDKKGSHQKSEIFLRLADKLLSIERLPREKAIERANKLIEEVPKRYKTIFDEELDAYKTKLYRRRESKEVPYNKPFFQTTKDGEEVPIAISAPYIESAKYHPFIDLSTITDDKKNSHIEKASTLLHELGHREQYKKHNKRDIDNLQYIDNLTTILLNDDYYNTEKLMFTDANEIYTALIENYMTEINAWENVLISDPVLLRNSINLVKSSLGCYLKRILQIGKKIQSKIGKHNAKEHSLAISEAYDKCLLLTSKFISVIKSIKAKSHSEILSDLASIEQAYESFINNPPLLLSRLNKDKYLIFY